MSRHRFAALLLVGIRAAFGQPTDVRPQVTTVASGSRVTTVQVIPRFVTAVRVPNEISTVVLGDPALFQAEKSPQEPRFVFVKPVTTKPARSNLLVTTVRGDVITLLLVSSGEAGPEAKPVDFLVRDRAAARFQVEPVELPSAVVPPTERLGAPAPVDASASAKQDPPAPVPDPLDALLAQQKRAPVPVLYGGTPGIPASPTERVQAGVSEVLDQGREVIVLFSAVNPQRHAIELMPPQAQLGGKVRGGGLFRRSRWGTAEQFPVSAWRWSRRRIGPGERADGVAVFARPPYKQSFETVFLQVAESGAVDRPALVPVGFGVSSAQKGDSHGRADTSQR